MNRISVLTLLFLSGATFGGTTAPPCTAQVFPAAKNERILQKGSPAPARDPKEFQSQPVTQPPHFGDMPEYPGLKYKGGVNFPNVHGGPSWTLTFGAADEPLRISQWYEQTFRSGGWKVDTADVNHGRFSGTSSSGNYCAVNVTRAMSPSEHATITIMYRVHRRK